MGNRKYHVIGAIALLILVIWSLFYIWENGQESRQLVLYGNIDIRRADVGFRVFGRLKNMLVEEGDPVTKGDLLAEIDPEPYVNSLKETEGRVRSLMSSLSNAVKQVERRRLLVKRSSVSEESYQDAYTNEKTLRASLDEANAAMLNAKLHLEDTRLICPSDGVIFTRIREPGTILNIGEPVYSIAVSDPVWARTYISELDLGRVYPGMPAEVKTDSSENPVYKGHIGFISPIAEFTPKSVETPDLRTNLVYQLRVVIDNPDRGLRQGMPVTVMLGL